MTKTKNNRMCQSADLRRKGALVVERKKDSLATVLEWELSLADSEPKQGEQNAL